MIICLVFVLIKVINYKLHILFDGEELLDNRSKLTGKLETSGENIELDIFSTGETNQQKIEVEPNVDVSLKKEIEDALGHNTNDNKDFKKISSLSLHDSVSHTIVDNAPEIIVDLHPLKVSESNICTKVEDNPTETGNFSLNCKICIFY